MYGDMGKLIGEGFRIWKRNLILCMPFLLATAISMLAIVLLVATMAALFGSMPSPGSITSLEDVVSKMGTILPDLAMVLLLFILVVFLINSFFAAGGIAMAEQAVTEGKTSTTIMWSTGRRRFLDMFVASILTSLITLAGLIFLLPGLLSLPSSAWKNLSEHPNAIGLIALGAFFLIIYLLVLSLVLAVVPYALIVDIHGPIEAIKASIIFFNYNKFDVFIMWLIVVAISLGLQMVVSSVAAAGAEAPQAALSVLVSALNVVVVAPLATVWWTSLYMSRTGKRLYQVGAENAFDEPK